MGDSSNDINHTYTKDLYKQNYKFINFQRSTEKKAESKLSNESIKTFYQNLLQTNDNVTSKSLKIESQIEEPIEIIEIKSLKRIDPKDFLKAAQNNDIKLIKEYIQFGNDPLVLDSYKWNVLMIAISSSNNEILKYLFENIHEETVINNLLSNQDSSGNTVESLAEKFKNYDAIDLIQKFKSKKSNEFEEEDIEIIEESEFYCESCEKTFKFKDGSHNEHITSIVHLLNENSIDTEKKKKMLVNYHLRGTNKGYQLMLKSGWKEHGLGSNEQGRTMPVKTKIKLDRLGIGVEKCSKPYVRPIKNVKLKSNKSSSDSELVKSAKSLKETIEKNNKMQQYERELRRYFDT